MPNKNIKITQQKALGSDAILNFLNSLGLDPTVMFFGHLGIYIAMGALALVTMKKPIDLEAAMAEHKATVEANEVEGPEPAPGGPTEAAPEIPSEAPPDEPTAAAEPIQ